LGGVKAYPWEEVREKLREMADLMNFAWHEAQKATSARQTPAE